MSKLETFASETKTVSIAGKDYPVRELSLGEKIRVLAPIANQLKDAVKSGVESVNLSHFLLSSADVLESVLKTAVPEFSNWASLPESETRDLVPAVLEVNDFGGFFANFISLATKIFPSPKA